MGHLYNTYKHRYGTCKHIQPKRHDPNKDTYTHRHTTPTQNKAHDTRGPLIHAHVAKIRTLVDLLSLHEVPSDRRNRCIVYICLCLSQFNKLTRIVDLGAVQ